MENIEEKYEQALADLSENYTAFHKVGAAAYCPGLEKTLTLASRLNNPHKLYRTIHVGGTNGKGSTAHTIAAVLQSAGLKVGLYTSPHLLDFRERIRVDGQKIRKEFVVDFMRRLGAIKKELQPSYFEAVTLMAFDYFSAEKVDIAVIEVGLGGRLDSTNIITPVLSVITNISLDHTAILGDTEEAIAAEKAGIIKPGIPAVIGAASPSVLDVFRCKAVECGSPLFFAAQENLYNSAEPKADSIVYSGTPWGTVCGELSGDCQPENAATIMTALRILAGQGMPVTDRAVKTGFSEVCELTGLMGRWMTVQKTPVRVICDTGHNIGCWRHLGPRLCSIAEHGRLHVVLGFVSDKDVDAIFATMPADAAYYFTAPGVDRARPAESTASMALIHGIKGDVYPDVSAAYAAAAASAAPGDTIFVGGSTFIVADLLAATPLNFS